MRIRHNLLAFILMLFAASVAAPNVEAVVTPTFPACSNPQGTLKVSYSQGTHGIVGNAGTYTGSDTVYTLSDTTIVQCFCADDGAGIQTNWWKATSLTDEDIQVFKNQGWYFVPNGSLWGLSDDPYMAKNTDYSCRPGTGGDSGGGGQILASSIEAPSVLGLATTGNIALIYGLVGAGTLSLALGMYLRRHAQK